jgi:hypothetical protein
MSPTYQNPHAATLLYHPEPVFRFACCELDDVRCQFLGDILLVNLALDNRATSVGKTIALSLLPTRIPNMSGCYSTYTCASLKYSCVIPSIEENRE